MEEKPDVTDDQPAPASGPGAAGPQPGVVGPQGGVVGVQPGGAMQLQEVVTWMPAPAQSIPGCPPGLEYLTQVDQILVQQVIEMAEIFLNCDFKNRYVIRNTLGQQVFTAQEESSFCHRYWCGPHRGFILCIFDNMQREVMRVTRYFKCCAGCCWCACVDCCAYVVQVESPPGCIIGYVRQTQSKWKPEYDIMNENMDCILKIRGPCCACQMICCQCDVNFHVMTPDLESNLGKISKVYGGWVKEVITKADNFAVTFPMDLDVKMKATLLGCLFLVDFMFFEKEKNS